MADTTLANRRHTLGFALGGGALKYFSGWIAAVVVLASALPPIIAQYRSIDISAWYIAANSGKIFTAIVSGIFLYTLLAGMIAQGVTRRELAVSLGWFGLLWSAALGALAIAMFLGEHALYSAFDWSQTLQGDGGETRLDSVGAALEFSARYPLVYLLYFTGGAIIGAAAYRSDWGWLVLVPVVPVVLALDGALMRTEVWGPGWASAVTGAANGLGTWQAVAVVLVAVAAGAWIVRGILLGTQIRAKQA
ncbi:hypothetical protein L0U85_04120 [Glycomyces sp. L485]|uniref:hypothetical protein n=1 Tax=Glycomyces sp. L485 TaxID=2909235 RepID=UPI001F4B8A89|nr:hypothetical protein [Glycomyces sp. L485]MCH7230048.1 hypothetical protein [Glycomyces sp. L485]